MSPLPLILVSCNLVGSAILHRHENAQSATGKSRNGFHLRVIGGAARYRDSLPPWTMTGSASAHEKKQRCAGPVAVAGRAKQRANRFDAVLVLVGCLAVRAGMLVDPAVVNGGGRR